jgi:hypothetical protein
MNDPNYLNYTNYLRLEIETLDQAEKWILAAFILGVINPKFAVGIQPKEGYNFTQNLLRATGLASGKCPSDPKLLLPIVLELLEIQDKEI